MKTKPELSTTRYWRRRIFSYMWLTYFSFYLCRVNYSVAQPGILKEFGWTKTESGFIASALLFAYAGGQFINGALGDKFGAKRMIFLGMMGSVLMNILFGFGYCLWMLILLWALNGYFQSMGWPLSIKTMANWFSSAERGRIMGLWGSCYQFGNLICWLLAGLIIESLGWRPIFWIHAAILLIFALFFLLRVKESPEKAGLRDYPYKENEVSDDSSSIISMVKHTVSSRIILVIAITYLCLGFVRYGFLTWAITYMVETSGATIGTATLKMAFLPLTGCLGAISAGWISDRLFDTRRAPVASIMLFCLAVFILLFKAIPPYHWLSILCIGVIGFTIYGVDCLLGTAAAQDFAVKGGVSSSAGFIDGMMYIGAVFSGFGTGLIVDNFGWTAAIYCWMLMALFASLLISTLWNKKVK